MPVVVASFAHAFVLLLFALPGFAVADEYEDTIGLFRAAESKEMFDRSHSYAVFPTVGKAGFVVGGSYGAGRVYQGGQHVGDTSLTQLSVGFQAGAQGFAMIVFLQDERAFGEFTSGNFEFGADIGATVITAGVSAGTGTTGSRAGASGGKNDASATGGFYRGMAVYTIARGGLMYEASVSGSKFTYNPRS